MKFMMNFLYLGNLIPEKGVVDLLAACNLLKQRECVYRCHIVGAGTRELSVEACKAIVESKGLSEYVKVYGPLYGDDKEKIWQMCDCFVFPTYYHNECFPLVILEAMQHSLPVIVTPVGAIPDMVIDGETGILVPVNDSRALAEAMEKLMRDPSLTDYYGAAGQKILQENYTCNIFEEKLSLILSES